MKRLIIFFCGLFLLKSIQSNFIKNSYHALFEYMGNKAAEGAKAETKKFLTENSTSLIETIIKNVTIKTLGAYLIASALKSPTNLRQNLIFSSTKMLLGFGFLFPPRWKIKQPAVVNLNFQKTSTWENSTNEWEPSFLYY